MRKTLETNVPVLVVGPDGTISHANGAAYRLLGYSDGGLPGRTIKELTPEDQWPELIVLEEVFQDGTAVKTQSKAIRADGRIVDVALAVEPSLDDDAQVVSAFVSCSPVPPWRAAN